MGLPELISDLYHDNIKYYPSHIDSARGNIPIIVERAVRNKPKYGDEKVEITLNNKVYSFKYCKAWKTTKMYNLNILQAFNEKRVKLLCLPDNEFT